MNDELKALGSVRARGILLLIVVVIAGGAGGGALDRLWMLRRAQVEVSQAGWTGEQLRAVRRGVEERAGPAIEEGIPITLRAVDLTDRQKQRIRAIGQRYRPVAESIARSVRPRVQEIDFRMRQEAMCVLTPKQRDDWIAWRRRERLSVEEGGAMLKLVTSNSCPADAGAP